MVIYLQIVINAVSPIHRENWLHFFIKKVLNEVMSGKRKILNLWVCFDYHPNKVELKILLP